MDKVGSSREEKINHPLLQLCKPLFVGGINAPIRDPWPAFEGIVSTECELQALVQPHHPKLS